MQVAALTKLIVLVVVCIALTSCAGYAWHWHAPAVPTKEGPTQ